MDFVVADATEYVVAVAMGVVTPETTALTMATLTLVGALAAVTAPLALAWISCARHSPDVRGPVPVVVRELAVRELAVREIAMREIAIQELAIPATEVQETVAVMASTAEVMAKLDELLSIPTERRGRGPKKRRSDMDDMMRF